MKYTTNDLSKILNVSTNTIRRYEEKGFLQSVRNESNGYREFDSTDVEKLMYTSKYRRIGFSQEEITDIFGETLTERKERFARKMEELDAEMKHLYALRHMMKDDLQLLKIIDDFRDEIRPYPCCSMHIVRYQIKGKVDLGKEYTDAIHKFLDTCPEYEHVYYFEADDFINNRPRGSEGVMANEIMSRKYGVCLDPPVEYFPAKMCLMRVVRVPLDLSSEEVMTFEEMGHTLMGQFNEYMAEHDMKLQGDVVGLKLGLTREDGHDWQYLLMHVPVGDIES